MTAPDEKAIALEMTRLVVFKNERIEAAMVKAITAALIAARRAALEEAAKVACEMGDDYGWATSSSTAKAILALIPTRPDGAAEGGFIGKQLPMPAYRFQTPEHGTAELFAENAKKEGGGNG